MEQSEVWGDAWVRRHEESAAADLEDGEAGGDQLACQVEAQLGLASSGGVCGLGIAACRRTGRHRHSTAHSHMSQAALMIMPETALSESFVWC